MLARVTAAEFIRPVTQGRTCPSIIVCEKADGSTVEVVAKFSAQCDQGVVNLAREAIAACLARSLGLPVPEAFLVDIPPGWSATIADAAIREKITASVPVAFGSRLVTGGYSAWTVDTTITEEMIDVAAAVFAFDGIIQNPDRRAENPNCLVRGHNIRIFDHELCFTHGVVLGWRPPWAPGGLKALETPGRHIFRAGLRRATIDYGRIAASWVAVPDNDISSYESAIPVEWADGTSAGAEAVKLIKEAKQRIGDCIVEVKRVLG